MPSAPLAVAAIPAVLLSALLLPHGAVGQCATGAYDAATDYFPDKLDSEYATGWDVTYFNNYKVIEGSAIGKIVAYQCGTPVPTEGCEVTAGTTAEEATAATTCTLTAAAAAVEADAAATPAVAAAAAVVGSCAVATGSGTCAYRAAIAGAADATLTVAIPLASATVLSTTYIPFLEIIGHRAGIKGVSGTAAVSSPCLREAIAAGTVANIGSANWAPSVADIDAAGGDATFAGTFDVSNIASIAGAVIPMAENAEQTGVGGAEWLEYIALFFNEEAAASTHIAEVAGRIADTEQAVTAVLGDGPKKKVLWVYDYGGQLYSGTCPNYYCEAIEKAGGEIMDLSSIGDAAAWGAITDMALFYETVADADIWLYPSQNWEDSAVLAAAPTEGCIVTVGTTAEETTAATTCTLTAADAAATPAVVGSCTVATGSGTCAYRAAFGPIVNEQVYDVTKNNLCVADDCGTVNDWFESRLAEPDVLLEDLVNIITPEAHPNHGRVWFRNVATETPSARTTCPAGVDSPYVLWVDDVAATAPVIPAPAPQESGAVVAASSAALVLVSAGALLL